MDTLVFDIETQNFFTDPDVGWDNFEALKISVVGVYSYEKGVCVCFAESELREAAEFFRNAGTLIGFSMNRYDIPVLTRYFQKMERPHKLDLWKKERIDLLGEIEMATKERIGLGKLAEINLGVKKTGSGAKAVELYRAGNMEELKSYCLHDVRITKELFDLSRSRGFLLVPRKSDGVMQKVLFQGGAVSVRLPSPTTLF